MALKSLTIYDRNILNLFLERIENNPTITEDALNIFRNNRFLESFFDADLQAGKFTRKTWKNAVLTNEKLCMPGIYLIGSTFFNPITKEEFYWVKVGQSIKISERIKGYKTENPMVWEIEFCYLPLLWVNTAETLCHEILAEKCSEVVGSEWFAVSRETYLEICEKKFNWFDFIRNGENVNYTPKKVNR